MKKFFNTLFYGDSKTKKIMWSIVILAALAVVFSAAALIRHQPNLFVFAMVLVIAAVIISQQYSFQDLTVAENPDIKEPVAPEDVLVRYTEHRIKQVFIKYKVKPDHRLVIVDSSEKYNIRQTPAYIWMKHTKFHMLLMEKNAREIVLPLSAVGKVQYKRAVPVNMISDYIQFRKPSLLAALFEDYMPTVYERGKGAVKRQYKNLYIIGEDIALTNRSIRQVFDLTGARLQITDNVTESGDYSEDFIEMYHDYTLFRDHVIDASQYRDRVNKILDDMAVSNMLEPELLINLEKMQRFHFLTPDYANYCLEKRKKVMEHKKKKAEK